MPMHICNSFYSNIHQVIEIEAMLCEWEYKRNDCSTRMIPEVYAQCLDWKRCADASRLPVSRTKVFIQLAAESLDIFFRYLSFRTIVSDSNYTRSHQDLTASSTFHAY